MHRRVRRDRREIPCESVTVEGVSPSHFLTFFPLRTARTLRGEHRNKNFVQELILVIRAHLDLHDNDGSLERKRWSEGRMEESEY